MFDVIWAFFPIFFLAVLGLIVYRIISGVKEWNNNNNSPILTKGARVISKHSQTHHHHHNTENGMSHTTQDTDYYVTFELESGERIELYLRRKEYAMLAEGDQGRLTFQGTRYKGFERK